MVLAVNEFWDLSDSAKWQSIHPMAVHSLRRLFRDKVVDAIHLIVLRVIALYSAIDNESSLQGRVEMNGMVGKQTDRLTTPSVEQYLCWSRFRGVRGSHDLYSSSAGQM